MSFYGKQGTSASTGDHRRKWDTIEYERLAQERIALIREEEDIKSGKKKPLDDDEPKKLLEYRDYKIDLESKVGKAVVISKTTPAAESGGFYCDICDCVVKDSINFLDHMNGKMHIKNLGMSMKIKRSTLDEVKERFAFKKAEMEREKREKELESIVDDIHEEEAKLKDAKKGKKTDRKRKREPEPEDDGELDPEMQAMMGFSGFGGSKKK